MRIQDYKTYLFSSGPRTEEDYLTFEQIAKKELKQMLQNTKYHLHRFCSNHYEFSVILQDTEGKYVFLCLKDVRFFKNWYEEVLYRTMKHEMDYVGGSNHYCAWHELPSCLTSL